MLEFETALQSIVWYLCDNKDQLCQFAAFVSLVFDGTPRTKIEIRETTGAISGEASTKGMFTNTCTFLLTYSYTHAVNKTKVLYGLPRDPELVAALVQLQEEEENENNIEDEKPKVSHHFYS